VSRNDRNILLLGLLIIVLLIAGYYFLILGPLLGRLGERAQERSDKEAQLANLQQQVGELEAVRRNAPDIEEQLLELNKRIPAQPEIPTLVVQVEEIAQAAGVTQLSIQPGSPGPPPGGGDFTVLPITMTFQGTYEELQDFLLRTRNLARLMTVNSVDYQEVEGTTVAQGTEQELQVQIEAEVYFQPQGVPSGQAPASPAPPATTTTPGTTAG
jgi:type IV pilus assembly protein PilO